MNNWHGEWPNQPYLISSSYPMHTLVNEKYKFNSHFDKPPFLENIALGLNISSQTHSSQQISTHPSS